MKFHKEQFYQLGEQCNISSCDKKIISNFVWEKFMEPYLIQQISRSREVNLQFVTLFSPVWDPHIGTMHPLTSLFF
jgi:hypothetical protein